VRTDGRDGKGREENRREEILACSSSLRVSGAPLSTTVLLYCSHSAGTRYIKTLLCPCIPQSRPIDSNTLHGPNGIHRLLILILI
jgi:hypothetical protein